MSAPRPTPVPALAPAGHRVDPATCMLSVRPHVSADPEEQFEGVILERGRRTPTLRVTGPDMHSTLARLRAAIVKLGL